MFGYLTRLAYCLYKAACVIYNWIYYIFIGEGNIHTNSPMSALFDDLLNSTTIDYTNTETKDIISAVEELEKRYVDHFNKTSFSKNIIRIQPCGSMSEKTSLWKWCSVFPDTFKEHKINYIEFDFLMVLGKPWDCKFKKGCSGCVELETFPKSDKYKNWEDKYNWMPFDAVFHAEFNSKIASMCDCYDVRDECISTYPRETHDDHRHHFTFRPKMHRNKRTCSKCTVYRKTGMLHIAKSVEADDLGRTSEGLDCSFRLVWKSSAKSLIATNCKTLRKSEPIHLLHSIAALPVFEINERDQSKLSVSADFVVPKVCLACGLYRSAWRASNCLKEVEIAKFKSNAGHQKCYRVVKCIFAQVKLYELSEYPNGYSVKTAMLTHCKTCAGKEDFSKCVFDVLRYFRSHFQRYNWHMPSSIDGSDIIGWIQPDSLWASSDCINAIVKVFKDVQKELAEEKFVLSCPFTTEQLFKRMKRAIKEELANAPVFER